MKWLKRLIKWWHDSAPKPYRETGTMTAAELEDEFRALHRERVMRGPPGPLNSFTDREEQRMIALKDALWSRHIRVNDDGVDCYFLVGLPMKFPCGNVPGEY
jgi:hypothetical protein